MFVLGLCYAYFTRKTQESQRALAVGVSQNIKKESFFFLRNLYNNKKNSTFAPEFKRLLILMIEEYAFLQEWKLCGMHDG